MTTCAMCGRVIKECCDVYYPVIDERTGKDAVLCLDCWASIWTPDEIQHE